MSFASFPRAVVLVLVAIAPVQAALDGPGPHWIDDVTGGSAMFLSEATVSVDFDFDAVSDLDFAATGPTKVFRSAAYEGDPVGDPGHDNHLDLEIYSMILTGTIPSLGPFTLTVGDGAGNLASDGLLFSSGTSDELPDDPRRAHDVFNLFFQVEVAGLVLHNAVPFQVESIIDRLPPVGSEFHHVGPPVPLLTASGTPLLQITAVVNRVVRPPPRFCDPDGVDAEAIAEARAQVSAECGCMTPGSRTERQCESRVLRDRAQVGILLRRCKSRARVCLVG
jgi:hypothetical protein